MSYREGKLLFLLLRSIRHVSEAIWMSAVDKRDPTLKCHKDSLKNLKLNNSKLGFLRADYTSINNAIISYWSSAFIGLNIISVAPVFCRISPSSSAPHTYTDVSCRQKFRLTKGHKGMRFNIQVAIWTVRRNISWLRKLRLQRTSRCIRRLSCTQFHFKFEINVHCKTLYMTLL
jgi:hypothetical protein